MQAGLFCWGEQPHARVIPSRKPEVEVFIKARSPCKTQPRYRDFHTWCLCLVSVLWSGVFSSQALPCDFGKLVHWAFFAGSSLSLRTTFICNTFPTAELQLLDSSLGSLQFFTFFLVFSLPVLLIQWIQVLKWIYFIKQYVERHLICNFFLIHLHYCNYFTPKGKEYSQAEENEQWTKNTNSFKRLLDVFQDKRRNGWKESKINSRTLLWWYHLLVYCSPLKTYLDPSLI